MAGDTDTLTPSWIRDFHVCSSFLMSLSNETSNLIEPVQQQISKVSGGTLNAPPALEEQHLKMNRK